MLIKQVHKLFRFCTSNLPQEIVLDEQRKNREKQLFQLHSKSQLILDQRLKFPMKLYGTRDNYQIKQSYMASRIMAYYGVQPSVITNHLLKIYKATLYAMQNHDSKFMDEYLQPGLKNHIEMTLQKLKKEGTMIRVWQDHSALIKENIETIQLALIRGLSTDRDKNRPATQYIKKEEADEIGMTIYTPKFLTQPESFIDPKANKTIYDDYRNKLVMRVLARIKSPIRLSLSDVKVQDELYTWQHLCIFQNELVEPKKFSSKYKLETYLEWLSKFKFGCWKLADLDNCMRGNSLIRQGLQEEFKEEVFKHTKFDTEENIDIKSPER